MKARLNLTIENDLLANVKKYAKEKGSSVSDLVEQYFKKLTVTEPRKSKLFEMVNNLPAVEYPKDYNFKQEYHKAKATKK